MFLNCYLGDPVPLATTKSAEDSAPDDFDCENKKRHMFSKKEMTEFTFYILLAPGLHHLYKLLL